MATVFQLADQAKRDYITPEDVSGAIASGCDVNQVRLDVLTVIGKQAAYGMEDPGLCASIAARGTATG